MITVTSLVKFAFLLQCVGFISPMSVQTSALRRSINKRSILIYPGTKWCGNGNKADSCEDLGEHIGIDKCCREHDYCPYAISKETGKYLGFQWKGLTTLSHCECDKKFFNCLNNNTEDKNGKDLIDTFFYGLGVQCFAYVPCDENDLIDEPKFLKGRYMNYGDCANGIRIRVFNIDKYNEYIRSKLSEDDVNKTKSILAQSEKLMAKNKLDAPCRQNFTYYNELIVQNFEKTIAENVTAILLNKPTTPTPTSSTTTEIASTEDVRFIEASTRKISPKTMNCNPDVNANVSVQIQSNSGFNNCDTDNSFYERIRLLTISQTVLIIIAVLILVSIFGLLCCCKKEKGYSHLVRTP